VFAVDEKTAIQALDRLDPVLPLSPGRAKRHGFEYYRHGTLSLLAALDTQSGEVFGQTVRRHTSAAFVEFLGDIVATQPKRRENKSTILGFDYSITRLPEHLIQLSAVDVSTAWR
jgi:hypothetical protein